LASFKENLDQTLAGDAYSSEDLLTKIEGVFCGLNVLD